MLRVSIHFLSAENDIYLTINFTLLKMKVKRFLNVWKSLKVQFKKRPGSVIKFQ